MNLKEPAIYMRLFVLLVLLLVGCQKSNGIVEEYPNEQGRKNIAYVNTLMVQHVNPSVKNEGQVPPPPIGWSYLTVGATYKDDTLRILLETVKELVKISLLANSPVDSVSIASLIKGDKFLRLNEKGLKESFVIDPVASIDSVKLHGKEYTLKHYFNERGYQKVFLDFNEQAYLIDALSNWGLLISQDDYIGSFHVREPSMNY